MIEQQGTQADDQAPKTGDKDITVEDVARLQGWVPKGEFKGNPTDWRNAQEFLDVGERIQPILRERNRALIDRLNTLENTVTAFSKHYEKVHESAYKRALSEIQAGQLKAVQDGNVEEYSRLERERVDLEEGQREKPPEGAPVAQSPPTGFAEFQAGNAWYGTNLAMTAYADQMGQYIHRLRPELGAQGKEFYDLVTTEVKTRFPEMGGAAPTTTAATTTPAPTVEGEGTSPGGGSAPAARSYDSLPADAKKECDRFVAEKLLTKEQYVADYDWEG